MKIPKLLLIAAVTVFTASVNSQAIAQIQSDDLARFIGFELHQAVPTIPMKTGRAYGDRIIGGKPTMLADTTQAALSNDLYTAYGSVSNTLAPADVASIDKTNFSTIAGNVAKDVLPIGVSYFPKDKSSNSWGLLSLWTGSKIMNPYVINPSAKSLSGSGVTPDLFIEIALDDRYVTRGGTYASADQEVPPKYGSFYPWFSFKHPDIAGKFGYVFSGGNSTNSYSASTIVGSSDIYGEGTLGMPCFRECSADYNVKQQFSLEGGIGFTTDKEFTIVHPNLFLGPAYQLKCPSPIGAANSSILWISRAGGALIDRPHISGTNVLVENDGGLLVPKYNYQLVPSISTSIILPVTSAVSLVAAGDVYYTRTAPAQWDITLGVTLDLESFAKGLGVGLGANP